MKKISILIGAFMLVLAACTGGNSAATLIQAGAVADSLASEEADGTVEVASPDLQASFTIEDEQISIQAIGQELFELFASQQLKRLPAKDITGVCNALRESKGDFITIINSPTGESVSFSLTPHQIIKLQRAKNSELNLGAARSQIIAIAQNMVPNPDAHAGAVRVDVSINKSFIEYNVVWEKASYYSHFPQGILTKNYFNPLKEEYQEMGGLAERVIDMLSSLNIDGVRMVYSAEDSDKELRQAFPWREIRMPIEKK